MLAVFAALSILASIFSSISRKFFCQFATIKVATVNTQKTSAGSNQRDQLGLECLEEARVWLTVAQTKKKPH